MFDKHIAIEKNAKERNSRMGEKIRGSGMMEAIIYALCVMAFMLVFAFALKWLDGDFDK